MKGITVTLMFFVFMYLFTAAYTAQAQGYGVDNYYRAQMQAQQQQLDAIQAQQQAMQRQQQFEQMHHDFPITDPYNVH